MTDDDRWNHHLGSHHVQLPPQPTELPIDRYWLSLDSVGNLCLQTVCQECCYTVEMVILDSGTLQ